MVVFDRIRRTSNQRVCVDRGPEVGYYSASSTERTLVDPWLKHTFIYCYIHSICRRSKGCCSTDIVETTAVRGISDQAEAKRDVDIALMARLEETPSGLSGFLRLVWGSCPSILSQPVSQPPQPVAFERVSPGQKGGDADRWDVSQHVAIVLLDDHALCFAVIIRIHPNPSD